MLIMPISPAAALTKDLRRLNSEHLGIFEIVLAVAIAHHATVQPWVTNPKPVSSADDGSMASGGFPKRYLTAGLCQLFGHACPGRRVE